MGAAARITYPTDDRFRTRIAVLRRLRRISQRVVADTVGWDRAELVSRVERGTRTCTVGEAVALCDTLGVDLAALLDPVSPVMVDGHRID